MKINVYNQETKEFESVENERLVLLNLGNNIVFALELPEGQTLDTLLVMSKPEEK